MRHRSLPRVVIPVPCHANWNRMQPIDRDGRARLCDACDKPVYDSQSMTRGELEGLIANIEGLRPPCLRLHLRPDGTIVTWDCIAGLKRAGRWLWLRAGMAALGFWTAIGASRPGAQRLFDRAERMRPPDPPESSVVMMGLGTLRREPPPPEVAWLERNRPPALLPGLVDPDQAPPLRVLEVEETQPESFLTPR